MSVPRSRTTDQRFYGIAEGIVVDNEDPLHEGRVKLTFPWFDPNMVSDWCRVCQVYAGNGYGTLFVPELRDEVLVSFIHGDMRLPVVLGGLYNGEDKPPSFRASNKDQKVLRTKGGHQIVLDDTTNQRVVRVRTSGGHSIELDDQARRVTVSSSGGHALELDDTGGRVVIGAASGASITLQVAGNSISIQGATVSVDAGSVGLGMAPSQPVLRGPTFLGMYSAHVHTLTPSGVTTPPAPPIPPVAVLSPTVRVP